MHSSRLLEFQKRNLKGDDNKVSNSDNLEKWPSDSLSPIDKQKEVPIKKK